jgi:hypothetical protein
LRFLRQLCGGFAAALRLPTSEKQGVFAQNRKNAF